MRTEERFRAAFVRISALTSGALLTLSLALNGFLLVRLCHSTPDNSATLLAPGSPETRVEKLVSAPGEPVPFHWRQLEASDYPTYIGNLRRIGCPDSTVRDIVSADLHAVFADRRQKLKEEAQQLERRGSESAMAEIKAAQQHLWQEEMSALNLFLRPSPESPDGLSSSRNASLAETIKPPVFEDRELKAPLVFQGIDFGAIDLTDRELETVERLRQKFLDQVSQYEPKAPDYPCVWRHSQQSADELLRTAVGWQRYNQISMAVAMQTTTAGQL